MTSETYVLNSTRLIWKSSSLEGTFLSSDGFSQSIVKSYFMTGYIKNEKSFKKLLSVDG